MSIQHTHNPGGEERVIWKEPGEEEHAMEMEDDGTGKRAYGTDDLELDDIDGGRSRDPGTSSQSSGIKANKRGKRSGNTGGEDRGKMLATINKRILGGGRGRRKTARSSKSKKESLYQLGGGCSLGVGKNSQESAL